MHSYLIYYNNTYIISFIITTHILLQYIIYYNNTSFLIAFIITTHPFVYHLL